MKDRNREREKAIQKQIENLQALLYEEFPHGSSGEKLTSLLEDMKANIWAYAKPPEITAQISKEYIAKHIINCFSTRLDKRTCTNAVKRLLTKLPK